MTISIPLKLEISLYYGTHFDGKPKTLTYRQLSPNIFFAYKLSHGNNSQSSSQSSRFMHPQ